MKKLNLSDMESIEIGIIKHQPLKKIGTLIGYNVSSISREIKNRRIFIRGSYYAGNDCKYANGCTHRHLCGDEQCPMYCYSCSKNCHDLCNEYSSHKCMKYESPPYACNGCSERRYCNDDRYFYDARVADKKAHECRVNASSGIHASDEELKVINEILSTGLKKGQPLSHILSVHEDELIISERTAYRYISNCVLDVRNIDLRRQSRYKRRHKKKGESSILGHKFRQGRSYQDFLEYMKDHDDYEVVEMDTVKGKQGAGKVLLTFLFRRNSVMLMFLMPDGKASSVKDRFDFLENSLGTECFKRLMKTCLTDNGGEFKKVEELEQSVDGVSMRTGLFYCDPMASGQKGRLEKNHEYIRYVIKKGTSLNPYTQEDITLLVNHINSTKRPGLGNKSPYELAADDEDMQKLMKVLDMHEIPADEVNLTKSLLEGVNVK